MSQTNNAQSYNDDIQSVGDDAKTQGINDTPAIAADMPKVRYHYNPSQSPSYQDISDEMVLLSNHQRLSVDAKRSLPFRIAQYCGAVGAVLWVMVCVTYLFIQGGVETQTPYEMGIFVAGMLAPIAFYWMVLSYMQRSSDVQYYAENLRGELHSLFFPSEEESQKVNKDIERMTHQAAEFAASSRAALKAIHRTRHGLRQEIKEFTGFAKKTETYLQALSNHLVDKTKNMDELVQSIEGRIATIEDKTNQSMTLYDNASATVVERVSEFEAMIDQQIQSVTHVSDQAVDKAKQVEQTFDATISSLGLTVDAALDRLGHMNTEFVLKQDDLNKTASSLVAEGARVGEIVDEHVLRMNESTAQTVESVAGALSDISKEKETMDAMIEDIVSKAGNMTQAINDGMAHLVDVADDLYHRAEDKEMALEDKAKSLSQSLNGFEDQIDRMENISDLALHQLKEGMETALSSATVIGDSIRRATDHLSVSAKETMGDAETMVEATISHIQQLKETSDGHVRSTELLIDGLSQCRSQIETATQTASDYTNQLTQSVHDNGEKLEASARYLSSVVDGVASVIETPIAHVMDAVQIANDSHEKIETTLAQRIEGLHNASERTQDITFKIRDALREQTSEMASLSGRVLAESKTMHDTLQQTTLVMETVLNDGMASIQTANDDLNKSTTDMSFMMQSTTHQIEQTSDMLRTHTMRLKDGCDMGMQSMSGVVGELLSHAQTLEQSVLSSEALLNKSCQSIVESIDTVKPIQTTVTDLAHRIECDMSNIKQSYEDVAMSVENRVDSIVDKLTDRSDKAVKAVELTRESMQSVAGDLKTTLGDLEQASMIATDNMNGLNTKIEGHSANIHLLADQTITKVETIQKTLEAQFEDVSLIAGKTCAEIEQASSSLISKIDAMGEQSDKVTKQIGESTDGIITHMTKLDAVSADIDVTTDKTVSSLVTQLSVLSDRSAETLSVIRKSSDSLSVKSKEMETIIGSVAGQMKTHSHEMAGGVQNIARVGDEAAQHVMAVLNDLKGQLSHIDTQTTSVVTRLGDANTSLYNQSGRFVTAVSKSAELVDQATDIFSTQTDNLLRASDYAVKKADELQQNELRVGRETFMNAARYVLESLHSLSIDFIRTIDGDIASKEWKAYQSGDTALFTSKLATKLDDMPADKIRLKYADDSEFRSYAQKFMRQFEDVLHQTDTVDKGAILGTTFAASDVGKIYRFLCNISGRKDKMISR